MGWGSLYNHSEIITEKGDTHIWPKPWEGAWVGGAYIWNLEGGRVINSLNSTWLRTTHN